MLLLLAINLVAFIIWEAIRRNSRRKNGEEPTTTRWILMIPCSLGWLALWLFIVGAAGMKLYGRPPKPSLVFVLNEILALGFYVIFRLTQRREQRGSRSAKVLEELENRQPTGGGTTLAKEAEDFLAARRKEREKDEEVHPERPGEMM